jgi:hypothetical protein
MSRIIRLVATYALTAAGVVGLVLLSACNIISPGGGGGTGTVHLLVTDSPSDDWQEVTVILKSVSIRKQLDLSWHTVWTAPSDDPNDPNAGKLNLVTFSGVSAFLGTAQLDSGKYDRLRFVIFTEPENITLIDSEGNKIDSSNITVVDPGGKGEIKVAISPPLEVTDGTATVVEADFDLAHPLSIIMENGKVVVNLQVRHKAVRRNLTDIQFARSLGNVTDADTANKNSFTLTTLEGAVEIKFAVNSDTKYVDVDADGAEGNFDGLAALKGATDKGALVASNMWSDGTMYARRVWYGTLTALPQFTPEGLVLRVGDNWLKVLNKNADKTSSARFSCHWDSDLIYVGDATTWTFHDTIDMGTGPGVLRYIRRGFRVTVELDTTATYRLAKSINVQSAHDEGAIRSVSDTGFVFRGWGYCRGWRPDLSPYSAQYYSHEWPYSKVVPDHAFSWWFFGDPASASDSTADFAATVNAAMTAHLRVFAWAELYWNTDTSLGPVGWVAENVILAPEKLPDPTRVIGDYSSTTKSMDVATFDWDNWTAATVMTIYLDAEGNLQTVVASYRWNPDTKVLTFTVPVLPGDWEKLLKASLLGVKVWVRPVKDGDVFKWHAYTVIGFQIVTP